MGPLVFMWIHDVMPFLTVGLFLGQILLSIMMDRLNSRIDKLEALLKEEKKDES